MPELPPVMAGFLPQRFTPANQDMLRRCAMRCCPCQDDAGRPSLLFTRTSVQEARDAFARHAETIKDEITRPAGFTAERYDVALLEFERMVGAKLLRGICSVCAKMLARGDRVTEAAPPRDIPYGSGMQRTKFVPLTAAALTPGEAASVQRRIDWASMPTAAGDGGPAEPADAIHEPESATGSDAGSDRAGCMSGGEDRVEGASMADRRYVASMFVGPLH
jgi:hypothetical protein